LSLDLLGIAV
jgi:hypothetical protein